ncbi:cytochrome P450 [Moorena producens JHB]|uniref:Cytochrome P450 n=2 Tax=Cyanophyceae TaxID=3028117 RepID=A0A1D9FXT5_MOOP1|nr:cytochrome P450 [Moorena producens]AAY42399.1 HctG [Lyngbya majuscula]AOY80186.1 cytochrome P450 [Moorena producens JHB]
MKLPPGPQTPAILQMIEWVFHPSKLMQTCAQRYGDTFTVKVGPNLAPVVFLSDPKAIQKIFTADLKQFETGKLNKIAQPLIGEYSLMLQDGKYHQRQRRLLMPPFHGERMRRYNKIIDDIAKQVISQWPEGKPFSIRPSIGKISLELIVECVFGLRKGPRSQHLIQLLTLMAEYTSKPLAIALVSCKPMQRDFGSWSPWGSFIRLKQQITKLIYDEIGERRSQFDSSRTDILTLLMSARDEDGMPMTDVELHDQLITFLMGGHDTTTTALVWAFYWIHYLPEVREKLLRELDSLGDDLEESNIIKLRYLNAVCSETLRINPISVLTLFRSVKSPLQLMSYQYDPGTILAGCIYLTHRREDLYPEPEKFKPERFLERQFSFYEYLPFGGGNRRCVGDALAMFVMKRVIATVLREKQLTLVDRRPVKPVFRGPGLAPSGSMQMVAVTKK